MKKPILAKSYAARRRNLENAFFSKEDARLIEQFKLMEQMKESKAVLQQASGIKNDQILEKLVSLDVRPETLVSLEHVPLIEVAWADGEIDEKERSALLKAAVDTGFAKGSIGYTIIEIWLTHRPPKQLLTAWTHYVRGLCEDLTAEEKNSFRETIIGRARLIAEASGGFLGLGNKISEAEQKMIDALNSAFEK